MVGFGNFYVLFGGVGILVVGLYVVCCSCDGVNGFVVDVIGIGEGDVVIFYGVCVNVL